MSTRTLRSMLDRFPGIKHACDLDLLVFFHRHRQALLTSEQLVAYLGYDRDRVARSLEGLIGAGIVTCSQNPTHAARLYMLQDGAPGGTLATLLGIAGTRPGRLDVLRLLKSKSGQKNRPSSRKAALLKVA